jgi:hypothetical protein
MFAQALIETGLLDSAMTTVTHAATAVEDSFADHPWIWIAALTIFLMLMMRPRK